MSNSHTAQLAQAEGAPARTGVHNPDFQRELTALIPQLRAFARSLCRNPTQADDLAQDALASAWKARDSYRAGTNLKAWVYLILRNRFYSDARRAWRSTPLNPEVAAATLAARDNVESIMELDEVRRALSRLTDQHREALLLVGVGGFSYDEAAEILKVPTGTVKSRVCRARMSLVNIVGSGDIRHDGHAAGGAFDSIVREFSSCAGTGRLDVEDRVVFG